MSMAEIRKQFGVPAKAGLKVTYRRQTAYIVKASRVGDGLHLTIQTPCKGYWWGYVHPTDPDLVYGTEMHKQRGRKGVSNVV